MAVLGFQLTNTVGGRSGLAEGRGKAHYPELVFPTALTRCIDVKSRDIGGISSS